MPGKKHIKSLCVWLGIHLYRFLRRSSRLIPPILLLRLGDKIGRFCALFFSQEERIARSQYAMVFPAIVAPNIFSEVLGHVGRAAAELTFLDRLGFVRLAESSAPLGRKTLVVTSSGQDLVRKIVDSGSGAVALSGHIGCIELLAAYHVTQGVPLCVVGRRPNYEVFARLLEEIRVSYGVETLWRNEQGSAKKLLKALKKGKFVAALIDQDTSLENGFTPFFGVEAAYPITIIELAVSYRIPLLSSFIVRTGELEHHIITEPLAYSEGDPDAVAKILREHNARLEKLILNYPNQWIWWHRRWRRRPGVDYAAHPELLPSTGEYLSWLDGLSTARKAGDA